MEGKSSKDSFNQNTTLKSALEEKGKTDIEARTLLNNYQKVAEDQSKDQKFMEQLENRYLNTRGENHATQGVQLGNLEHSARNGLQRSEDRQKVIGNLQISLQTARDKIMHEAKEHYHANYSLTKNFDEKSKDKDVDLER